MYCKLTTKESKLRESISVLGGIDTLYTQLITTKGTYLPFYNDIILNNKLESREFEFLGMNRQYHIYRMYDPVTNYTRNGSNAMLLPYCRILFKNLNERDGLEYIFIQLEAVAIHKYGLVNTYNYILDKLSLLGLQISGSKVNRVDYNHFVFGMEFAEPYHLSLKNFHTKASIEKKYTKHGAVESYYFGKQLKLYDKKKESEAKMNPIVSVKNWAIHQRLEQKYNKCVDMFPFWNIEFSLKREELKSYKVDTLEDVLKYQESVHKDLLNRFRLLERKPKTDTEQKNKDRIPTHPLWNILSENIDTLTHQEPTQRETKSYHHIFNEDSLINASNRFLIDRGLQYDDFQKNEILNLQKKLEQWKDL